VLVEMPEQVPLAKFTPSPHTAAVPPDSARFVWQMRGRGDAAASRRWRLIGIAAVLVWPTATVSAQAGSTAPTACRFEPGGSGKAALVVDGRSFTLEDGREIRLAGIEVPPVPRAGESGPRAEAGRASRTMLEAILGDGTVELRTNGEAPDRYGRILAFAYRGKDRSMQSAAHEMLGKGFARVAAQVGDRACAEELWAREGAARQAKLGLWGTQPYYAITAAESLAELMAGRGQFSVVEGRVWSVRESGGTIYVNFGRRWSEALTVTISKRNERTFAAAGVDPRQLERRRVRVRGYIEERSGPRIEASSPEQIEVADRR
jgi:endonuclease YncB( thermonuclease family)